jgi:hypothetical protein
MDQGTLRALAMVSGLGFAIAIPLGLLFLGGLWLDTRMGTRPLFMLLGIVVGLFVAGVIIADLLSFQQGKSGRLIRRRAGRQETTQGGAEASSRKGE